MNISLLKKTDDMLDDVLEKCQVKKYEGLSI
jgi:hypothetical protein